MQWYLDLAAKIPVVALLLISASGVITGDFFAKTWSINERPQFFVLAVCCYLTSSLFYIPTLLREGLVFTSIIWSLIGTIGFLVLGLLVFHEHLTTLQAVGVAIGVIALVILSVGE